ncbi:interleukin-8-like [Brienomyrus brachyistius]|uniref:interleukin-8-like n=1 Tax=Brienomyrus brachyistius TaxID=42636 RepID=UPI0020B3AB0D|nr:interleukin-8-like [Brienomyrus brachyistius]
MNCKLAVAVFIVLLAALTVTEGMSMRGLGMELRCRCIQTESQRIGRLIESVEIFPPSQHCKDTEIIATLKGTGQEICLDPNAPWVKRVIERILANRKP